MFWLKNQREAERYAAIVEHAFAANAIFRYATFEMNSGVTVCMCGWRAYPMSDPTCHREGCPVPRYLLATERLQNSVKS
jgi:hypothetical protein